MTHRIIVRGKRREPVPAERLARLLLAQTREKKQARTKVRDERTETSEEGAA